MKTVESKGKMTLWLTAWLGLIISGSLMLLTLTEFYKVSILNKTSEYPFGGEGATPYYYKSADLYSTINFIWGLTFLLTFIVTAWKIFKREIISATWTFILTLFLLGIFLIHGQIET